MLCVSVWDEGQEVLMEDIRILDACCGSRMFWFDKQG